MKPTIEECIKWLEVVEPFYLSQTAVESPVALETLRILRAVKASRYALRIGNSDPEEYFERGCDGCEGYR